LSINERKKYMQRPPQTPLLELRHRPATVRRLLAKLLRDLSETSSGWRFLSNGYFCQYDSDFLPTELKKYKPKKTVVQHLIFLETRPRDEGDCELREVHVFTRFFCYYDLEKSDHDPENLEVLPKDEEKTVTPTSASYESEWYGTLLKSSSLAKDVTKKMLEFGRDRFDKIKSESVPKKKRKKFKRGPF
jgi:hypothetical protein